MQTLRKTGKRLEEKSIPLCNLRRVLGVSGSRPLCSLRSDELAADEKYKGKTVILTGYIQDIGKTQPVFPFQAARPILVIGSSGTAGSVGCVFHESATSRLARLSKGESVVVAGKARGKDMGVAVVVIDCILK